MNSICSLLRLGRVRSIAAAAVAGAAMATAAAAPAGAQTYVSVHGGADSLLDGDVSQAGLSGEVSADLGYTAGATVGLQFMHNIRADVELIYRRADLDNLTVSAFGLSASGAIDGNVTTIAAMINAYYDIPLGRLKPYVMVGAGAARVEVNDIKVAGTAGNAPDFDDDVFAFQGGGGVAVNVVGNLDLTLNYRYFQTEDPTFDGTAGGPTDAEYRVHSVTAGVRYWF